MAGIGGSTYLCERMIFCFSVLLSLCHREQQEKVKTSHSRLFCSTRDTEVELEIHNSPWEVV